MNEFAILLRHYWPDWLSLYTGFLLIARLFRPVLTPSLSAWLLCGGLLSFACILGLLPFDPAASATLGCSLQTLVLPALWVCVTVGLAAAAGVWSAAAALLPAVLWRMGISPAPVLFDNYLDVPLLLAVVWHLVRRWKARREKTD